MCMSERGSEKMRGCSFNLSDRLGSTAGHNPRLTHLANVNTPPPPFPPPPPTHLCVTLSVPLFFWLSLCLSGASSFCCPLSKLVTHSFPCLSFLFPFSMFLWSMKGNFHCSFYPGTGFHCGNTALICFPHQAGRSSRIWTNFHKHIHKHTSHTTLGQCSLTYFLY